MDPHPIPAAAPQPDPLEARFAAVRQASLALAAPLSAEDCVVQSMPDASPIKWHLAHTTWFFETFVLEPRQKGFRPFDPAFRVLYNSYYNSVGEQHPRPRRGLVTRPGLDRVLAYRRHVDEAVGAIVGGDLDVDARGVIEVGIQHEQQHQELILTDVKHLLAENPLRPAYRARGGPPPGAGPTPPLTWRRGAAGLREIGHEGSGFSFDNERPRHRVYVEGFEIGTRLITAGEYLAFMADGGYTRPELWLSEGWTAVNDHRWRAPLYWERRDDAWHVFTLDGLRPLAEDEPVCHVSLYEADAYARWAGARLPTEAEWESVAAPIAIDGNFVESARLHPVAAAAAVAGPLQIHGDVWEWTQSAYAPYPGYAPLPGALGEYNGKFMCSQTVLRGGSCATPRSHVRPTYRNFFPPGARWQFTGIRLARDVRA